MENKITVNKTDYVKANDSVDYSRQIDAVLKNIGSEMTEALVKAGAMVAGGALTSVFTHQEVNDVDVYFKSKESLTEAFISSTVDWQAVYLGHTDKSITLKDRETGKTVQFIYFDYFSSLNDVFEAFDFTVCMAGIDLSDMSIKLHKSFLTDVASRTLYFNNKTRFPYISLIRTRKYQERGYKVGKGGILSIAQACANLRIENWQQAKEQLGGVYGNEIDVKEVDTEFSQEALYELLQEIPEERVWLQSSEYELLYKELLGTDYSDRQR